MTNCGWPGSIRGEGSVVFHLLQYLTISAAESAETTFLNVEVTRDLNTTTWLRLQVSRLQSSVPTSGLLLLLPGAHTAAADDCRNAAKHTAARWKYSRPSMELLLWNLSMVSNVSQQHLLNFTATAAGTTGISCNIISQLCVLLCANNSHK